MDKQITTDLSELDNMIYSGRGIIIGMSLEGNPFIGYSLTGRSPSSQARELIIGEKTNTIRTNVTDRKQLEQGSPALLLYPALTCVDNLLIASNGAQTELLYSIARDYQNASCVCSLPKMIEHAFRKPVWRYDQKDDRWIDITTYEPDTPNNTPRINGLVKKNKGMLHIIYADENLEKKARFFPFDLEPGKGHLITTYNGGNETPLKPFDGNPREISIFEKSPADIAEKIYEAILGGSKPGENYRVASAVMMNVPNGIITQRINRSDREE
jgi:IMP cyclohydrolase